MQNVDITDKHWHEAIDRTQLALELVTDWLLKHPVIHQHDALRDKTLLVIECLQYLHKDLSNANLPPSL